MPCYETKAINTGQDGQISYECQPDMHHVQLESHEHLFSNCIYTKSILEAFPVRININWSDFLESTIIDGNTDSTRRKIAFLYVAAAFHAVWLERNRRIHNHGHATSTTRLIGEIRVRVREEFFTCPVFKKKASKDASLQLLLF